MTQNSSLKNIVVVGGGTAGWLAALYAKMRKSGLLSNLTEQQ